MKIRTFTRWLAACSLASVLLYWADLSISSAATTEKARALATDPRPDMLTALKAVGPHPSLGDQAKVFGRCIGTWDGEGTEFSKDGKATHSSGEWMFGWVMDGRAIQVLFIIRPSAAHQDGPSAQLCAISILRLELGA